MTLQGLRVLNTRPHHQAQVLSMAIEQAGGIACNLPALAILPTPLAGWFTTMPGLSLIQQAVFTSTNAVTFFFNTLKDHQLIYPKTIYTLAIGQATAHALLSWGVDVNGTPTVANSEHLLQLDTLLQIKDQHILVITGINGRRSIVDTLRLRLAHVIDLAVYRRALPNPDPELIETLWRVHPVDIILLTSEQAIHQLFILFGKPARRWLCQTPCVVISDRLAQVAYQVGMRSILVSRHDSILNTLNDYKEARAKNTLSYWRPNQGFRHDRQP